MHPHQNSATSSSNQESLNQLLLDLGIKDVISLPYELAEATKELAEIVNPDAKPKKVEELKVRINNLNAALELRNQIIIDSRDSADSPTLVLLKDMMKELEVETVEEMKSDIHKLETMIPRLINENLRKVEEKKSQLNAALELYQQWIKGDVLEEMRRMETRAHAREEKLLAVVEQLREEKRLMAEDNETLSEEVEDVEQEKQAIQSQLHGVTQSMEARINSLYANIRTLQQTIEERDRSIEQLNASFAVKTTQVTAKQNELERQIKVRDERLKHLYASLAEKANDVVKKEEEIEALRKDQMVQSLKDSLVEKTRELCVQQNKVVELEKQLSDPVVYSSPTSIKIRTTPRVIEFRSPFWISAGMTSHLDLLCLVLSDRSYYSIGDRESGTAAFVYLGGTDHYMTRAKSVQRSLRMSIQHLHPGTYHVLLFRHNLLSKPVPTTVEGDITIVVT